MAWQLLRVTDDLTDDGNWRGLSMASAGAPDRSIFVACGGQGAKVDREGRVAVRIGWLNALQQPVAGAGTSLTAEPVTIDALQLPTNTSQTLEVLHVGTPNTEAIWAPVLMFVGSSALATVRISNAVNASATRVGVWIWV